MDIDTYFEIGDQLRSTPVGPIFYHGTVLPLAKEILQYGLHEKPDQKFMAAQINPAKPPTHEVGHVYITRAEQWARNYAEYRARLAAAQPGDRVSFGDLKTFIKNSIPLVGGTPTVLEIHLTPTKLRYLRSDPEDDYGYTIKSVGPRYIKRLHVFNGNSWIREEI